jgi:hypothetical protein
MSSSERWEMLFNILSFAMAALAAYLWLRASRIKLPPHTGDDWAGRGPFADALKKQSQMNARAALAASIAALFQGLSIAAKLLALGSN